MELQEFVRETLLQVSRGIKEANEKMLEGTGKEKERRYFFLTPGSERASGTGVDFDVAVTVTAAGEGKIGAKVRLAVVEADLGGGGGVTREQASRVKFTVSVDQYIG